MTAHLCNLNEILKAHGEFSLDFLFSFEACGYGELVGGPSRTWSSCSFEVSNIQTCNI